MGSDHLPLEVVCPLSDRYWPTRYREWSDEAGLFSATCPSCGHPLRFAITDGKLAEPPGWAQMVRKDHDLVLAGGIRK